MFAVTSSCIKAMPSSKTCKHGSAHALDGRNSCACGSSLHPGDTVASTTPASVTWTTSACCAVPGAAVTRSPCADHRVCACVWACVRVGVRATVWTMTCRLSKRARCIPWYATAAGSRACGVYCTAFVNGLLLTTTGCVAMHDSASPLRCSTSARSRSWLALVDSVVVLPALVATTTWQAWWGRGCRTTSCRASWMAP